MGGKEVRMMTLRKLLVLTLLIVLVVLATSLPFATPPAEASVYDEAHEFAQYLCKNYLSCE